MAKLTCGRRPIQVNRFFNGHVQTAPDFLLASVQIIQVPSSMNQMSECYGLLCQDTSSLHFVSLIFEKLDKVMRMVVRHPVHDCFLSKYYVDLQPRHVVVVVVAS